ncbi:MAG: beta-lactamase family protein [Bacteroidetes bacterium]|nr:beta-lactamase family protein [Bacteroidota bacterium]
MKFELKNIKKLCASVSLRLRVKNTLSEAKRQKHTILLSIFVVTCLSCGNSNSSLHDLQKFTAAHKQKKYHQLSKSQQIISDKLDNLFTHLYKTRTFNGSVLVAKGGKIIFQKSLGIESKERNAPLTDSSMFQLASVSKVITATAALMLYERGTLDLEKELNVYLPDFPYENIRVKDLLCHRSGLPNYIYAFNDELYRQDFKMSNVDMYNFLVEKRPYPYLRPNRRFNYCNTNYAMLALLIEKISGKNFSQFVKEEIFEPLGMKHSATIHDIDLNGANITQPYDLRWKTVDFDASDYVLGDKSIYSTPYDLFLFSEALYQNKLIKPETQHLAYTPHNREWKSKNYGYGWRMINFRDTVKKEVYHNGWWHGYRSSFHRRLKDTLTVVLLSNQLNHAAYQTNKIYQIIDNTNVLAEVEDED